MAHSVKKTTAGHMGSTNDRRKRASKRQGKRRASKAVRTLALETEIVEGGHYRRFFDGHYITDRREFYSQEEISEDPKLIRK